MATVYNNPGNIEFGQGFAGETGETYGNGRFAVFESPEMGLRAIAVDLSNKIKEFDGDVNKIVAKYAPPSENETAAYARFVKDEIGEDKITQENLAKAVAAIVKMENKGTRSTYLGDDLNDYSMINEAIELSRINLNQSDTLSTARSKLQGSRVDAIPSVTVKPESPQNDLPIVDADRTMRTVGQGDTVSKIAREQGMSVDDLLALNPDISDPNLIKVGQELTVRKPESKGLFGKGIGFETPLGFVGFNEGGMAKQMELFEEGGMRDEGGTVDPVSGNDVPTGSLQEEVRDDVPAMLSEGEFVMPADVVRYHGLDKMMALRDEAKAGLARMEAMGQMGNSEEAVIPEGVPFRPDNVPFDISDLLMDEEEPVEMQAGGYFTRRQERGTPVDYEQLFPSPPSVEYKTYINDQGQKITIAFIDGVPTTPIPEGYRLYEGDPTQTTPTVGTEVPASGRQVREDDPSDEPDDRPGGAAVFGGKAYDISYDMSGGTGGGLAGVAIGALTGGIDTVTITDRATGRQATMSRDLYNTLKQSRNSDFTLNKLNELFDMTEAANQQIRQSTGYEKGLFSDNSKEIGLAAAKTIFDDLGLEYKGQPLSEALMLQAEAERETRRFQQADLTKPSPTVLQSDEMRALGFEGRDMTDGTVAPDFTPFPQTTFTSEGPQYPAGPDGIGTGDTGTATITQPMIPTGAPQVPIFEQSPVVPAFVNTGDTISLPQSKPTAQQLYEYNYGTAGVPDTTGTGVTKTAEMAQALGQDPFGVPSSQQLSPLEQSMLQPTLERVDEPQSPIFEQSPVVPAIVNTGETMAMPTPASEVRRLREDRVMDSAGDPFDRPPASADEIEAMADRDDSPALTSDEIEAMADREYSRQRQEEREREAEIRRQDEIRRAAEEAEAAKRAATQREEKQQQENKHGFYDERVRDDQGTATKIENNQVYYDSDHDWSKPTQTSVRDDNDSGGGGGGCFLTTAVVKIRGQEDDGETLTILRKFRDEHMGGKNSDELKEYYEHAPKIVEAIPVSDPTWRWIGEQIDIAVMHIKDSKPKKAYTVYRDMFNILKDKYL